MRCAPRSRTSPTGIVFHAFLAALEQVRRFEHSDAGTSDTCLARAASRFARSRSRAIRCAWTAIVAAKATSSRRTVAAAATPNRCRRTNFFAR